MSESSLRPLGMEPPLARKAYAHLLRRARKLARKTLERVRGLHDHYPADLPGQVLDKLQDPDGRPATEQDADDWESVSRR